MCRLRGKPASLAREGHGGKGAPLAALLLLLAGCGGPGAADTRRDALAPMRAQFDAADVDGDEALTRREAAHGMPRLLPSFDEIDTDGNARVSAAELRSYLEWQRVLNAPPPGSRELRP